MARISQDRMLQLARDANELSGRFLAEFGEATPAVKASVELQRLARQVVWARHYTGDDGWEKLKNAIGELEDVVGRPARETDI